MIYCPACGHNIEPDEQKTLVNDSGHKPVHIAIITCGECGNRNAVIPNVVVFRGESIIDRLNTWDLCDVY